METREDIIRKNKERRRNYISSDSSKDSLSPRLKYLRGLISRVLITIIFVLTSMIFVNASSKNKELYKKYVFEDSLQFTKISNIYKSLFGEVNIGFKNQKDDTAVFASGIKYTDIGKYKNSSKLTVGTSSVVNVITSGIVVFIGDKDDFGNTIIIQGNDGVDIWYSNITDTDITVYDYVEKGNIIGTANTDDIYITISRDGEYLSYEEYQKLI
ncbi:MAG: M23 family metallopeptidase [Bacilli bacterium]|nr:M23 family metallopeptidase [Bacilli bacterium]